MRAGSSYTSLAHIASRCASPSETLQPRTSGQRNGLLRNLAGKRPALLPFAVLPTALFCLPLEALLPVRLLALLLLLPSGLPLPLGSTEPWAWPGSEPELPLLPTSAPRLLPNGNAAAWYGSPKCGSATLISDTGLSGASGAVCQNSPACRHKAATSNRRFAVPSQPLVQGDMQSVGYAASCAGVAKSRALRSLLTCQGGGVASYFRLESRHQAVDAEEVQYRDCGVEHDRVP